MNETKDEEEVIIPSRDSLTREFVRGLIEDSAEHALLELNKDKHKDDPVCESHLWDYARAEASMVDAQCNCGGFTSARFIIYNENRPDEIKSTTINMRDFRKMFEQIASRCIERDVIAHAIHLAEESDEVEFVRYGELDIDEREEIWNRLVDNIQRSR